MARLTENLSNVWKIPDLRRKILFTLFIFVLYRLGGHIPLPGISMKALSEYLASGREMGGLLGLYDLFVGGAFRRATIFATGIMPYITASIILQLLGAVVPYLQKLQKMGEEGRRKINQYTRYGTFIIALFQGWGMVMFLRGLETPAGPVVQINPVLFVLVGSLILSVGAGLIMWLGELINVHGIGNGMSLLITIGIVARLPQSALQEAQLIIHGGRSIVAEILILGLVVVFVAAAIYLTQGSRNITVQYARRVVGRRVYGGQSTNLPIKINAAGVMPIIFAQSVMFIPQLIISALPEGAVATFLSGLFGQFSIIYNIFYAILIVFFAYFYTAVIFNPADIADNLKKYGGFVPGRRPGPQTSEYIDRIITRVTLPGAIALALIAILPDMLVREAEFTIYFGGTSLLIIVGVSLDTLQQIETHLLMRHYDGFLKQGRIRGRR